MDVPPTQTGVFPKFASVWIRFISKGEIERSNKDQTDEKPMKERLLQRLVKYASSFAAATP